ncbi:MAG: SGNH/GDSL hydrolase family protein [Lachnospiraceae bacterium]|nr:SGNH/GDSL hydrolase family protein [Lachnospiraceae bacterium]
MSKKHLLFLSGLITILGLCGCGKTESNETSIVSGDSVHSEVSDGTGFAMLQEPVSLSGFSISEEGLNASVIREGNSSRIRDVLLRADAGEEITIAFIGGSITQGSNASPMNTACYAYQTYDWFVHSFPEAQIHYVNAGIGATDSYLGVHRLEEDVLSKNPDLVIVEFAVNDGETYNKESYECLLRRVLTYKENTAVLPLILTTEGGWDNSDVQQLLAFNYDLPVVSYKELLRRGEVNWSQVGDTDGVHPKNGGHTLIAHILTNYFYNVCKNGEPATDYTLPGSLQTKGRYMDAGLYYANEISTADNITVTEMDGFVEEAFDSPLSVHSGYGTAEGGKITFSVEAKAIGLCYAKTAAEEGGRFVVSVDGVEMTTLDTSWDERSWNKTETVEVMKEMESGKHTLTIESVDGQEGSLHILALMISE